jgi:hypothetical protein
MLAYARVYAFSASKMNYVTCGHEELGPGKASVNITDQK